MKLRKVLSSIVAGAVAVSAMTFAASAAIVDTEVVIDDSWTKYGQCAAGVITEACTIEVKVKDVLDGAQLSIKETGGWTAIDLTDKFTTDGSSAEFDTQWGVLAMSTDTTSIKVELNADDAKLLNDGGAAFAGKLFTLVSVDFAAEEATTEEATTEEAATGAFKAEFAAQFDSSTTDEWPSFADKTVAFDYDKEVTMSLDMGKAVKFGGNYIAINTDVPYVEGMTADVTSFKLDGAEVEMGAAYLNNEGTNSGLRLTILNLWNADIAEQPVDAASLGEFQTIDITFIVNNPDAAEAEDATEAEDEAEDATEAEDEAEDATEDEAEDEDAAAEIDWDSYDEDAMVEANEAFTLGGAIDIYAVVGDAWTDIAKIEADFVWTPGLGGWCGGAGIGNGAVAADGSTWISGPEYGAANANSKYEPDGKATQVLVDLSENPLTAIASVTEDGETTFGHIQIQNWWNGVEANAQVAAIRFLDADGEVIGELEYEVEVPEAPEAEEETTEEETAPEAGDVSGETDSSKGSPDTGIEDVAVVAGLAIVAGGAVLVSKKRK